MGGKPLLVFGGLYGILILRAGEACTAPLNLCGCYGGLCNFYGGPRRVAPVRILGLVSVVGLSDKAEGTNLSQIGLNFSVGHLQILGGHLTL